MERRKKEGSEVRAEVVMDCAPPRHSWHPLKIVGAVVGGIIGVTALAFIFGYVVMLLWNWLMPPVFGLKTLTYLQTVGLIVLAKILIAPFIPHMKHHRPHPPMPPCPPMGPQHGHFHEHAGKWNDWKVKGGWGKWKYYDQYWREEGKAAFEKYIERREKNNP
ncbi:MAG: hypothetical protein AABZ39_10550 [Spirochaetota bacterium]